MSITPAAGADFSRRLRRQPQWRSVPVAVIAAAALLTGCTGAPTPPNHGMTSTTDASAPSAIPLPPNDRGYVRVEMKSGSTGCSITTDLVACQNFSGSWRIGNGQPCRTVSITGDGRFQCVKADLGALQGRVTLDYQTYRAQGWRIVAGPAETGFTNDRSGHGMSVDDQRVNAF